jgi:Na+/H+ antiporter NhaD/arsenite permease-like protein
VFLAGLASSQVLSNLPATMLLARFTSRWPVLAWAVNLAGNGLAPASLANLIAVQLAGGGLWGRFHRLALPFMGVSALAAWLWLAWGG